MRNSIRDSTSVQVPSLDKRSGSWLPYVIIALCFLILSLEWDSIPDWWPVHWNLRGEPDGWSAKSALGVFLPLAMGLLVCLGFESIKLLAVRSTMRKTSPSLSEAAAKCFAAMTRDLLVAIQIGIAIAFSSTAVILPLARPLRPTPTLLMTLVVMAVAIVWGLLRWSKGILAMRGAGLLKGIEGWNGLVYRNHSDPRLWVPKITGLGYTLNFARREAWGLVVALVSLAVLAIILGYALSR